MSIADCSYEVDQERVQGGPTKEAPLLLNIEPTNEYRQFYGRPMAWQIITFLSYGFFFYLCANKFI